MIVALKQQLRELRTNRLVKYGNVGYQRVSNDLNFENVPAELRALWYGQNCLSFNTLSIARDSDIDVMSNDELVRWIENEQCLLERLEKIFSILNKKERRYYRWRKLIGIELLVKFLNKKQKQW
ncbi:hypothetical protein I4Q36_06940 [Tuanshanicoccus lijuaniae]|uniref:hypothetical protein n=1 Tax=Aerococcaceae bacterium zg-1292 TaxID=2774330 RepID=UPI001938FFF7|nr:hypothetical protein [Aerococcaceae bacterium zg-1292]QQA38225.1 hypothetical protein I4Q36_06940 [Aerococcaceae bacterium zg-1292]